MGAGVSKEGVGIEVKGRVRLGEIGAWQGRVVGELGCNLSLSSPLAQVLSHPLHPLPAQGSENPGR